MTLKAVVIAFALTVATFAQGAWHEAGAQFRREVVVGTDAGKIRGDELGHVRFLGNGKQKADGADVRVTTATGKLVGAKVVMAGPGDWMDVVFNTVAGEREYLVYFSNEKPRPMPDETMARAGLTLEIKPFRPERVDSAQDFADAWKRHEKTAALGRRLIGRPYLGVNLFEGPQQTITKVSGKLNIPSAGSYGFAVSADDRGALFIDGKPVVFARHPVGDVRFQERATLDKGWHDFEFYLVDFGGEYRFTVAWRRPDSPGFEIIPEGAFGTVLTGEARPLEEQNKTVTADLKAEYLGEAFFANNYSHRYRFNFVSAFKQAERVACTWEFGDGQRAQGQQVEHVYLTGGTYAVAVEAKLGAQSDRQVFQLPVMRDLEKADQPATDEWGVHAKTAAGYDAEKLSVECLPWAVVLQTRVENIEAAIAAGMATAKLPRQADPSAATKALQELEDMLIRKRQPGRMAQVLAGVPQESNLNPWAARERAEVLAYCMGDFAQAVQAMEAVKSKDAAARRTYGQVLVLAGRAEEGRKVLEDLPIAAAKQKAAAISGAMARTTEFYVQEKDVENGEKSWEKWMEAFPADFLDGNAVDMRVKLIAARQNEAVAAKVAEAFANAAPQSAYAPRLLDAASRLLEKQDAAKSKTLRQLLKQRYPEDPLSQK